MVQVEHHDMRARFAQQRPQLPLAAGRPDQLEIRLGGENRADAGAYDAVVVQQQDPGRPTHAVASARTPAPPASARWLTVSATPMPARRGGATGKSANIGTATSHAPITMSRSPR